MGEKYLQSKSGSLEDLATKIASKQSEVKVEQKVKLETPKTYLGLKENSVTAVAARVVAEALDPVNKDAVKKDFKNRNDKDIDNDGDVDSTDKYLHTRRQAISKAVKSETHTFTAQPINQKQKDAKGEKEVINPLKQKIKETISKIMGEGKMKDIATDKSELERLKTRLSQLQDRKAADTGDTTKIEKDILQTQRSIKDVQLKLKDVPKEVKEAIDEKVGDDAKRLGLTYYKFGRYGKDGKVTHTSKDGRLVSIPKKDQKSVSQAPKAAQTANTPKKSAPSAQPKTVKVNTTQISNQANKAINKMANTSYTKDNYPKLAKDLSSTIQLIKSMTDADKTQGSAGDGYESSKRGFKSQVIDTFQNLDTLYSELITAKEDMKDEETQDILDNIITDMDYISDEDADHDGYTKDGKIRSAIDDLVANSKKLEKKLGSVKEAVDEPYAVGMAQAKKLTGDKPPLEKSTITKAHDIAKAIMKKEQDVSKAAVDKFHTKLDKLVHKSFGHSSDEKKVKTEKKTYSNLKAEVENGKKTMTGQKPATIDTEPRTQHI